MSTESDDKFKKTLAVAYLFFGIIFGSITYYLVSIFHSVKVFMKNGPDVQADYKLNLIWIVPFIMVGLIAFAIYLLPLVLKRQKSSRS